MKNFSLSCGVVLFLSSFLSAEIMAMRRLVVPSMRLRVDGAGSNATENSVVFPVGPLNNPLKVLEARYRFEFANLSGVSQHVAMFLRPGSRIGVLSSRYNYNNYDPVPNQHAVATISSRTRVGSVILNPYLGDNETLSNAASQAIYIAVACDLAQMKCQAIASTIDASGVDAGNTTPFLQTDISPSMNSILQRDMMVELIGNVDIEVTEDRGVITASVGAIANRVGGFHQEIQQSAGNIALNGGRPF